MANYRQIHVSIWKDAWFLGLTPEKKLLFVYLFSNSEASISGIYKIAFPVICFETGLAGEAVTAALDEFEKANKIMYADGVLWIKNMRKFHSSQSPKVLTRIRTDLENIPDCPVKISYLYGMDTRSYKEEEEKEEEKEIEKEDEEEEEFTPTPFNSLMTAFISATGIPDFGMKPRDVEAGKRMVKAGVTPEHITLAIEELGDNYTINSLASVEKASYNVMRKRKGKPDKGREMTAEERHQKYVVPIERAYGEH